MRLTLFPVFSKTGPPSLPSNLTLLMLSVEQSAISWAPPFSLPGVTLSYFVNVTNLNTSGVFNLSELRTPSFNFSGTKDGSPCDVYQFTVIARNAAGWSDPSNTFTDSLPSGMLVIRNTNIAHTHSGSPNCYAVYRLLGLTHNSHTNIFNLDSARTDLMSSCALS